MSSLSILHQIFLQFGIPSRKGVGSLTAYQEAKIFDEKYFTNWDGRSRMHAHYFHNLLGLSYLVH
jgi:hypothetical protein